MTFSAYQQPPTAHRLRGNGRALVLGCGDVGSAVAHRLFSLGVRVALCDLARPAHARRGMAYTDALFAGHATLDGVTARRVEGVDGILECWRQGGSIPLVVTPEAELLAALAFDVLVEATMRRRRVPPDLRALAPCTIGLGPGFATDTNCHIAIETQWGDRMGEVIRAGATAALSGGPKALDGVTRERFVTARITGVWRTAASIGQPVHASEELGRLGDEVVCAPIGGTLRGITHDGVEVRAGQKILEIDPRREPQVFGLGERPLAIASGVVAALALGTT